MGTFSLVLICEFQPGKLMNTAKITERNLFRALELCLFSKLKATQVGNVVNILAENNLGSSQSFQSLGEYFDHCD